MKTREKNLERLMKLPYKIEIQPIPESDGGGFAVSLPQLGKYAVCGEGETIEEALRSLEEVKKERFQAYMEAGVDIPEPETNEDQYSGKFVLRIPKSLHRELSLRAKQNNVSLNHFVSHLLSAGLQTDRTSSEVAGIKELVSSLRSYTA